MRVRFALQGGAVGNGACWSPVGTRSASRTPRLRPRLVSGARALLRQQLGQAGRHLGDRSALDQHCCCRSAWRSAHSAMAGVSGTGCSARGVTSRIVLYMVLAAVTSLGM